MRLICIALASFLVLTAGRCVALAQFSVDIDIELAPFRYSDTEDDNRDSRLIAKLKSKEIKLEYT